MLRRFLIALLVGLFAGPLGAGEQAGELRARHRAGQTFLTWREAGTPLFAGEELEAQALKEMLRANQDKIRYQVYRSDKPIQTLEGLEPIGDAGPLSCWNPERFGVSPKPGQLAPRYVVEDGGKPLPPGAGLYVHNPQTAGKAWYAVTVSVDGVENRALESANVLREPVAETVGQGEPVLQRVREDVEFNYRQGVTLHYYVRWEAPPNGNRENRPIDYMVGLPPTRTKPAPAGLHLHCWGGDLEGGYIWWNNLERGAVLIASNQIPYDWWTGYHELYGQGRPAKDKWERGVVRPYTTDRLLSFLDWAAKRYDLDLNRVFAAGSSMGGSGAPMFAIRRPDRIAWARGDVGVHVPARSPNFASSYRNVYGNEDWDVKFENGAPVWDYYNDVAYLRAHPAAEIGFITWSNGKNDGGIGWPQAVEFLRAMQETRRPHLFVWGLSGHGQRARMPQGGGERNNPLDIRLDQSLPAFTNCSLDDDPGTAKSRPAGAGAEDKTSDPFDGAPQGQVNLYLYWETADIEDSADGWTITVGLIDGAPAAECTVDVTPRRLQQLKPRPGQQFRWTNTAPSGGDALQTGAATADRWGLLTLKGVRVGKSRHRIRLTR